MEHGKHNDWSKLIRFDSGPLTCGLNFRRVFAGFPITVETIEGSVLLKAKEGINSGKTFAWFEYASTTTATYVFKMDTDTAIDPIGIHMTILDAHLRQSEYIGFAMTYYTCGYYAHCPRSKDWTYMSGAFYGVSNTLMQKVIQNKWVKAHTKGIEDLLVGKWLYRVFPHTRVYNVTCIYDKNTSCPVRHYQRDKQLAAKKFITYGRHLKESQVALTFRFNAGLANQLIAFQKVVCEARRSHQLVAEPNIFHCDKTSAKGMCNGNVNTPLKSIFVISKALNKTMVKSDFTPYMIVNNAFYIKDYCMPSAYGLNDIIGLKKAIIYRGRQVLVSMGLEGVEYVAVQYRTGDDWKNHDKAFPNSYVSSHILERAVGSYNMSCITITPESSLHGVGRCRRVNHASDMDPLHRLLIEYFLASRSTVFLYNTKSTMHHVVRRLTNSTRLVPVN